MAICCRSSQVKTDVGFLFEFTIGAANLSSSQSKEKLFPLVDLPVRQLFNPCVIQHTAPVSVCKLAAER